MSTYSQPVHTITNSEKSLNDIDSDIYRPKYISQLNDDKINNLENGNNKLPLNLFHSAAEYNKMLIRNGKNRRKKNSPIIDGIITSLEYVNDHIFEKQIQKQTKARTNLNTNKPFKKNNQDQNCICCCCQDYCQECATRAIRCPTTNKLSQSEVAKAKMSIDNEIIQVRTSKLKYLINQNDNNYNRTISYNNNQNNKQNSRNSSSYYCKAVIKNHRKSSSKREFSSINNESHNVVKSTSQTDKIVSHLIMKSQMDFHQQKKLEQIQKINQLNIKKAKQDYLQQLNHRIRQQNLQFSRLSRSKKSNKSISKHQTAILYWQKIRNQVIESMKNDNYSKPLKKQLTNFQMNVYEHQELTRRKIELNQEERELLRRKHEQQAIIMIEKEFYDKLQKKTKIKTNLQHLEKQRKKRLGSCEKKSFKPTADMIQNAFKNIIEPAPQATIQKETEIFKNQRIKKNRNKH